MAHVVPEEDLISYVKPYLKAKGFKKKNKRWTKDIGDFTLCFYIQGSCYNKEDYYIRPGVFINALPSATWMYGHFKTEIQQTSPEEILTKFEKWCEEYNYMIAHPKSFWERLPSKIYGLLTLRRWHKKIAIFFGKKKFQRYSEKNKTLVSFYKEL